MKFMIPFLIAILPVASVAQSPSGGASGVPSVAIPKTTEVLVIQTAKQGVTPQQVAKEQLMDHEYVPVGPLMPLRALMGPGAQNP